MFNPFLPFEHRFINAYRKKGERYLVSQIYKQAVEHFAEQSKIPILFSAYSELNKANIHLQAVKTDKYAAILDLEKDVHRTKLTEMLHPASTYQIFSDIVISRKNVEERLNKKYENNIRRYINNNTRWKIGSDKTIVPRFEIQFGNFFVILSYYNETIKIKLEELEKA